MFDIPVHPTNAPRTPPKEIGVSFGEIFTDHMFMMDYSEEKGWHGAQIVPFGPLQMHPSSSTIQYAQSIFDGSKGYRRADGGIQLFRPQAHVARLNRSAEKLCMPQVDPDMALDAIRQLVKLDQRWVPEQRGTAIYVRQVMIGTEGFMVVRPSRTYTYLVFLCPVGSYYSEGAGPVRILVSDTRVRAARGGIGAAKAGANYAASLYAGRDAAKRGFSQVLWLDSVERRYLEEVGTMNVMVKIGGRVMTPPLSDSILPGITRDSVIALMRDWGTPVAEEPIAIDDVMAAAKDGSLEEMWGVGTAAVISPIGELTYGTETVAINGGVIGPTVKRLYEEITGLQYGTKPDGHGWIVNVA